MCNSLLQKLFCGLHIFSITPENTNVFSNIDAYIMTLPHTLYKTN